MFSRTSVAVHFSLMTFFVNDGKQISLNAAQCGEYIVAPGVGNTITPLILRRVFVNSKSAADFLQILHGMLE